jgi:hypothetical protein
MVVLPDGVLSQVVGIAGDKLAKRVGLPWQYEGSLFATDTENVACFSSSATSVQIDGLKMASMASWVFPITGTLSTVQAMAIADGRLFVTRSSRSGSECFLVSAPIDRLEVARVNEIKRVSATIPLPIDGVPRFLLRDGLRLLVIGARRDDWAAARPHGCSVFSVGLTDQQPRTVELELAVPDEMMRAAHVAEGRLVLLTGTAHADAISIFDAQTFECELSIVRDAVIPRFTATLLCDDTLIVLDDRPGLMIASLDALRRAYMDASDPHEGARAAARALRATWRESPLGRVQTLDRVPGKRAAIVVEHAANGPVARLWTVPAA